MTLLTEANVSTAVVPPERSPSLTTLAAMTGYSRSTVADWLNALEDAGWVKRDRQSPGSRNPTSYTLLVGSPTAAKRDGNTDDRPARSLPS
ncbi:helix-turn-helix domain-containing protein [Micromonospora sp. 4G57]|uniref:Helix-turn-helix domain-containing protein n=2 Tax=Micromonospora TaxID=1873 RepID=A0ABU5JB87_9ACTN|nr:MULTISPECIES: helix-turn-helix domain-containing protein [unclassified Micromonospora]MDZ5443788.1 helix-turn-helix domain-containing protein [Micromonospora sp. 4G57]MDZ5489694.1 helix-turn-helix domain-containing protein [Micromonospora sp. 4G53]